jgi:hypothetical protein
MAINESAIIFNCLIKFEDGLFVAHCLELDIVATGATPDLARSELNDLIIAQVDYAFSNDNLEHLYHPAPSQVWKEYFDCMPQPEQKIRVESRFRNDHSEKFVPPWIISKTCLMTAAEHNV